MKKFHDRLSALLVVFGLRAAAVAQDQEVFVDPGRGSDATGDGSSQAPYQTLRKALYSLDSSQDCVLRLAEAVYSAAGAEQFPLSIGNRFRRLTIAGPETGAARLEAGEADAAFNVGSRSDPVSAESLEFKNLWIAGGAVGISVVGGVSKPAAMAVTVDSCRFEGQKYQAVEIVAESLKEISAVVRRCNFTGAAVYTLDLGTRLHGILSLQITDNEFHGQPPAAGPAVLRNGLCLFADGGAAVTGVIARNLLVNTGQGILLTSAAPKIDPAGSWPAAIISLEISNNAIANDPAAAEIGLHHGALLSLHRENVVDMKWLHNTLAGGQGYGLFLEGFHPSTEGWEFCAGKMIEFAGNLIWGFAKGELGTEEGAGLNPQAGMGPQCFSFHRNAVQSSRWVEEGGQDNLLAAEADFLPGKYQLAEGSQLIDAGSPDLGAGMDLTRRCRVADGNGDGVFRADIGAYETGGLCVDQARLFKRGDADLNGVPEITDAIKILSYLFLGFEAPRCADACDSNDDGEVDITDGIHLLSFLFLGTVTLPPPSAQPGFDPTADLLPVCLR
ncbi:MAG: DUF1565 domain-containing protein [Planctomycetes bacterium]|nr:DUF1565 domain-containing protein [Planctomycetota bacterium]